MLAWVIMPNHVHLVLRPQGRLSAILRWLKTATATRANRLLGKTGEAFWQREYFDRWVRSEKVGQFPDQQKICDRCYSVVG